MVDPAHKEQPDEVGGVTCNCSAGWDLSLDDSHGGMMKRFVFVVSLRSRWFEVGWTVTIGDEVFQCLIYGICPCEPLQFKALQNSLLRLDIYSWLAFRLCASAFSREAPAGGSHAKPVQPKATTVNVTSAEHSSLALRYVLAVCGGKNRFDANDELVLDRSRASRRSRKKKG